MTSLTASCSEVERPRSAFPGYVRALAESSRVKAALGDPNPRYRADNILDLELDMPTRTTQDYEEHQLQMRAAAQQQAYGQGGGGGGNTPMLG